MVNKTRLYTLLALAGAAACGGVSTNDFSDPVGSGGSSAAATGGTSAKGGSTSTGGSGGTETGGSGGTDMGGTSTGGNAGAGADGGTGGSLGGTGADGGTAGTTGGSGAAGGMGATGGSGAMGGTSAGAGGTPLGGAGGGAGMPNAGSGGMGTDCTALMKTYQDTLTAARACNPKSGKAQCTLAVPEAAVCGCEVYANPDNTDAIDMLMSLREQAAHDCLVACPAIACIAPMPSNCRANPTGDSGQCTPGGITP